MARTGQQMRRRAAEAMRAGGTTSTKPRAAVVRRGWRDRMRYAFDNSMSRGTPALIGWLVLATVLLIVVFSVITTVFGLREDDGLPHGFWHELFYSLLHALDPGTIAGDDQNRWRLLLVMLVLTIAGLFIVSALIGVIAAGIDERLAELRRGRSIVLERDHTVILGWSESIFTIISELSIANESRTRPVIVVLAERDKVEMEDEIRAKVPDLRGTRVVCRSGSPMDVDDLRLASHTSARSVVLLAPASEDPDAEVIKTLLALTHDGDDGPVIVAEIRNPSNLGAARLAGAGRVVLLDIRDTVAKLLVQTSRQSGAAAVYTELFDYDGDEIYFLESHGLAGCTYAEALLAFESAALIGIVTDTGPVLNPPGDSVIGDHALVLVAEDDSALAGLSHATAAPDPSQFGTEEPQPVAPSRTLVIGWNDRAPIVLRELDKYATPGSTLTVLTSFSAPEPPALSNIAVTIVPGSTTDRQVLERHVVEGLDQLLVLCYSEDLEEQAADARTLVTLLHVRDILSRLDVELPLVTEMLDDRNRVLAEVAHVDDVVVSGEIVSLVVTQLSEDRRLEAVFGQLLDDTGSEVYLRPASWYVQVGVEVSFATIVASAARRGETAIGYKSGPEVVVNPAKSELVLVHAADRVVVLAEH